MSHAAPSAVADTQWRVVGASAPGTGHLARSAPCQDRFVAEAIRSERGEWVLIAAVADGAGSAGQAEQGAHAAVEGFIDCVVESLRSVTVADLPEGTPLIWLKAMQENVLEEATKAGRDPSEYACTFLAAVVGEGAGLFVQIGDGVIAVRRPAEAEWNPPCLPQHGEYVNQTWFLTNADALERAQIRRLEGRMDQVALTSDGLEGLCMDRTTSQPFSPFFDALMATISAAADAELDKLAPGLERFLASDGVNARTDDDKSLVLATRRPRS